MDLLQKGWRLAIASWNEKEGNTADFMQRTSTTSLGQSVRDGCDWPIQGQEGKNALFFRRLQRAVETEKLQHQVGDHVSQVRYMLRKWKLESFVAYELAEMLESLLIAWSDVEQDERSCRADSWTQHRICRDQVKAYAGTCPDTNLDLPWCPDPACLQLEEDCLMEALRREEEAELEASRAQHA